MTKLISRKRIKPNCSLMDHELKGGYLFTRLAITKSFFEDTDEIDSIVSELIANGFIFILSEEIDGAINLVFENPHSLFLFEPMADPTVVHEKSLQILSEYMDQVVAYPYKVIPEVYWHFAEEVLMEEVNE